MEQENELQEFTREPDVDDLKSDFDRCREGLSLRFDLFRGVKPHVRV